MGKVYDEDGSDLDVLERREIIAVDRALLARLLRDSADGYRRRATKKRLPERKAELVARAEIFEQIADRIASMKVP